MAEFTTPSFLENSSEDEIHEGMKAILPADIDVSEGSHAWNFTRPTALVAAELREFILPEIIKLVFPEWSYGEYLDSHAKARKLTRRPAAVASGELTITGEANSVIPAGSLFSTAAINDEPSVDYETLEEATIPTGKTVIVPVQCTQAGIIGNTTQNTVVLVSSKLTGITAVTNEEPITGGTEEETDESLIERILYYDETKDYNYVGSVSDYKRWATSVPGVGEAVVIPAQDDSGLVTIILTDSNGDAATETLCTAVYNYIMNPEDEGERLAPVNAFLSVIPPAAMALSIQATVELEEDATIESVKTSFLAQLALYLPVAMEEEEIKYTRVASALSAAAGVNDYSGLQIGVKGEALGTANIPITTTQLPTVAAEDLALTNGTV